MVDIVELVSGVVPLKKAGANYKGLCPFHNEKTPSFVVSPQKQIFNCFGCGAKGDVIEFVKRYYSLSFPEAIEKLAKDNGIQIENPDSRSQGRKDEMYEINRIAARFFYDSISKGENPGYSYLLKRGIEPATIKKFGIGYADGQWDSLIKHFEEKGIKKEKLLEAGLVTLSNEKYFDKFRDRVMFPIINTGGKVVGFGGRVVDKGEPKYLNSPETPVFYKKNQIYGLNITRTDVGKAGFIILVEGYMDVIALYQKGIKNVGASLGTALTENQAKLIRRYVNEAVLSYDQDTAGIMAAVRGLPVLYKEGLKAKALILPEGKDPDDFIREKGKENFMELLKEAMPYPLYMLSIIEKDSDLTSLEGRLDFLKKAAGFLRGLSEIEREGYLTGLSIKTGIAEGAIRREMEEGAEKTGLKPSILVKQERLQDIKDRSISSLEKTFIRLLITREDYLSKVMPYEEVFESYMGISIYEKIKEHITLEKVIDIKKLTDSFDEDQLMVVNDIRDNIVVAGREAQVLEECILTFEAERKSKREKAILEILDLLQESFDEDEDRSEREKALMEELMSIQKERSRRGGI